MKRSPETIRSLLKLEGRVLGEEIDSERFQACVDTNFHHFTISFKNLDTTEEDFKLFLKKNLEYRGKVSIFSIVVEFSGFFLQIYYDDLAGPETTVLFSKKNRNYPPKPLTDEEVRLYEPQVNDALKYCVKM
jgi:hypothetical protein